jgi:hypothetical protein
MHPMLRDNCNIYYGGETMMICPICMNQSNGNHLYRNSVCGDCVDQLKGHTIIVCPDNGECERITDRQSKILFGYVSDNKVIEVSQDGIDWIKEKIY